MLFYMCKNPLISQNCIRGPGNGAIGPEIGIMFLGKFKIIIVSNLLFLFLVSLWHPKMYNKLWGESRIFL